MSGDAKLSIYIIFSDFQHDSNIEANVVYKLAFWYGLAGLRVRKIYG